MGKRQCNISNFLLELLLMSSILSGNVVNSFQTSPKNFAASSSMFGTRHPPSQKQIDNVVVVLSESKADDISGDDDDLDDTIIEPIILSDAQIKVLRKEASKRKARKILPIVPLSYSSYDDDESMFVFDEESVHTIAQQFMTEELVEVRGISTSDKKKVFQASETLAIELAYEVGRDVVVVSRKGFAATLYCPYPDDDNGDDKTYPNRIILRTSVGQKNTWTKREKPERDNRGQIIKD